ncbi:hypothetical protein GCM10018952_38320 [Streptosporangium vulgare]
MVANVGVERVEAGGSERRPPPRTRLLGAAALRAGDADRAGRAAQAEAVPVLLPRLRGREHVTVAAVVTGEVAERAGGGRAGRRVLGQADRHQPAQRAGHAGDVGLARQDRVQDRFVE